MNKWLRYLWAMPVSALGFLLACSALAHGRLALVDGALEAHGAFLRWCLSSLIPIPGGASAITLGHVILARDAQALRWTRSHERVHVSQYERWGLFFLPAYAASSVWAAMTGRHPYFDNYFEREAMAYGEIWTEDEQPVRQPSRVRRAAEGHC